MTHGLLGRGATGQCIVLSNESAELFQQLLDEHVQRLRPVDEVEFGFVEEMAACHWRLRRSWTIETNVLDNCNAGPLPGQSPYDRIAAGIADPSSGPALSLLHRYETRLHTMYQRALHNLLVLRAAIPPSPDPTPESNLDSLPVPASPPPENTPADNADLAAKPERPNEPNPVSEHGLGNTSPMDATVILKIDPYAPFPNRILTGNRTRD